MGKVEDEGQGGNNVHMEGHRAVTNVGATTSRSKVSKPDASNNVGDAGLWILYDIPVRNEHKLLLLQPLPEWAMARSSSRRMPRLGSIQCTAMSREFV